MWWPFKKKPAPLAIPPYVPPVRDVAKQDSGIEVQEHDTSKMTETGVHKAWKRLTAK